jgi:hypothetical protein
VDNKVHLWAENRNGEPCEVAGQIVDSKQRVVVDGIVTHGGRAKFQINPAADETYAFACNNATNPRGIEVRFDAPLPPADAQASGKLTSRARVLKARDELQLEVAATKMPAQFVVAAQAGDALVGQQFVDFDDTHAPGDSKLITLLLAPEASGLLDVTLFDWQPSPPRAIGHSRVYRQPARYLRIELTPQAASTDDDRERYSIDVRDEQGKGRAVVLGVNVQAVEPMAPIYQTQLAHSAPEEEVAERLAQDQYFLDALDRSELELPSGLTPAPIDARRTTVGLTEASGTGAGSGGASLGGFVDQVGAPPGDALARAARALVARPSVPAVVDNLPEVESAYRASLTTWRDQQENRWRAFAVVIVLASTILIFATLILVTLRLVDRIHFWLPSLTTGIAALVIAGVWLNTASEQPLVVAARPVAAFQGERLLAESLGDGEFGSGGLGGGQFGAAPFGESLPTINLPVRDPSADQPVAQPVDPTTRPAPAPIVSDPQPKPKANTKAADASRYYFGFDHEPAPPATVDRTASDDATKWFAQRYLRFDTMSGRSIERPSSDDYVRLTPVQTQAYGEAVASNLHRSASPPSNSPTLYWNPLIETDTNGHAEIEFPARGRYRMIIEASGRERRGRMERVFEARK